MALSASRPSRCARRCKCSSMRLPPDSFPSSAQPNILPRANMKLHLVYLGLLLLFPDLPRVGAATLEDADNNGQDITRPINRFDVRMQVKTLPDATEGGRIF